MAKKYRIRQGFVVRVDERTVLGVGEIVELEDDVAKLHAHKLELVQPAPRAPKAPPAAPPAGGPVQTAAQGGAEDQGAGGTGADQ